MHDMPPLKGDVEIFFAFARRIINLDDTDKPGAIRLFRTLAADKPEPCPRFDEQDFAVEIMLKTWAEMLETEIERGHIKWKW